VDTPYVPFSIEPGRDPNSSPHAVDASVVAELFGSGPSPKDQSRAYMLNTRNEEKNTVFYSLFIISLFYEYRNLEYVYIHVICRVIHAEYGISFLVAVKQTACRCPTVGAAAPAALGGWRAGA